MPTRSFAQSTTPSTGSTKSINIGISYGCGNHVPFHVTDHVRKHGWGGHVFQKNMKHSRKNVPRRWSQQERAVHHHQPRTFDGEFMVFEPQFPGSTLDILDLLIYEVLHLSSLLGSPKPRNRQLLFIFGDQTFFFHVQLVVRFVPKFRYWPGPRYRLWLQ